MKKILIIFIVLSILLLCSCNGVQGNNSTNNSGGSYSNNGGQHDIRGFSLESYKEYLEYIENNDLPDGFVYYDDIKEYGEFVSLAAPGGINSKEGASVRYGYSLLDGKGYEHYLAVANDKQLAPYPDHEEVEVDISDMRYTVSGEIGYYYHNDVLYSYTVGKLLSIKWYEDGWLYTISDFSDGYPDNDGSALAKLIYLE